MLFSAYLDCSFCFCRCDNSICSSRPGKRYSARLLRKQGVRLSRSIRFVTLSGVISFWHVRLSLPNYLSPSFFPLAIGKHRRLAWTAFTSCLFPFLQSPNPETNWVNWDKLKITWKIHCEAWFVRRMASIRAPEFVANACFLVDCIYVERRSLQKAYVWPKLGELVQLKLHREFCRVRLYVLLK